MNNPVYAQPKRVSKKRRIGEIIRCMYRLDAVFPEIESHDADLTILIVLTALMLADGTVHPCETRLLPKLFDGRLKLRREDIDFVVGIVGDHDIDCRRMAWLSTFLAGALTPAERDRLVTEMWALAEADAELHKTEEALIHRFCDVLGMTRLQSAECQRRAVETFS